MKHISQSELIERLEYNADTGIFRRKSSGRIVGTKTVAGYLATGIGYKTYLLHRLAWMYVHGWLPDLIDHINRDKADNRICNLRPASKTQNAVNSHWCLAKSGFRGVYYQSNTAKWRVKIARVNVGYFHTKEAAYAAYRAKAIEMYGEFARAE